MKSKLFFRHIKQNILKYTVAFSAVVHLTGIFLFPSWGTVPDLVKEKVIKIKTVVQKIEEPVQKKLPEPDKKIKKEISKSNKGSEPTIPKMRKKTPLVKTAQVVGPSPVVKSTPVPMHYPIQSFKPMKVIHQDFSIPRPVASFKKMAQMTIPSTPPARFRPEIAKKTLIASSRILSQQQGADSFLNTSQVNTHGPTRQVNFNSEISSPHFISQRKQVTQVELIDKPKTPILNLAGSKDAIARQNFASMIVSSPTTEIQARSAQIFDSKISAAVPRTDPISETDTAPLAGSANLLQMASIPSGFIEETINGTDESNEISADQMGRIKMAFSSQVRTKIEQTKYYPRTARRRGFEGRPVVAFTLGNTGDLLEISIKKPSNHKLLDEAALDAVRSAGPYPPIPELLKLKTLRFKLPISFILEEP